MVAAAAVAAVAAAVAAAGGGASPSLDDAFVTSNLRRASRLDCKSNGVAALQRFASPTASALVVLGVPRARYDSNDVSTLQRDVVRRDGVRRERDETQRARERRPRLFDHGSSENFNGPRDACGAVARHVRERVTAKIKI